MQVDKHAPVLGVKMSAELVEGRSFAGPPLSVENDRVVGVLPDQVPPDEREDVLSAKKHLRAADHAARDVRVHVAVRGLGGHR